VRGVEPLAPQQSTHGADILSCIGLIEDGAPILGSEAPPARAADHFGIGNRWPRPRHRGARCVGSFSATLEAANAAEEVRVLLVIIKVRFLSPPYSNC
jgi:hypothetical protein